MRGAILRVVHACGLPMPGSAGYLAASSAIEPSGLSAWDEEVYQEYRSQVLSQSDDESRGAEDLGCLADRGRARACARRPARALRQGRPGRSSHPRGGQRCTPRAGRVAGAGRFRRAAPWLGELPGCTSAALPRDSRALTGGQGEASRAFSASQPALCRSLTCSSLLMTGDFWPYGLDICVGRFHLRNQRQVSSEAGDGNDL